MKVIAAAFLTEGDWNYRPGSEITQGQLYEQAVYYASIGKVTIIEEVEADVQSGSSEGSATTDGRNVSSNEASGEQDEDTVTLKDLNTFDEQEGVKRRGKRK